MIENFNRFFIETSFLLFGVGFPAFTFQINDVLIFSEIKQYFKFEDKLYFFQIIPIF